MGTDLFLCQWGCQWGQIYFCANGDRFIFVPMGTDLFSAHFCASGGQCARQWVPMGTDLFSAYFQLTEENKSVPFFVGTDLFSAHGRK
jgi:hypothetical protein